MIMFINKKDLYKPWINSKNKPFIAVPSPLYYAPSKDEIENINKFYKTEFIEKYSLEYKKQWNCCKFAESYKVAANLYFNKFMNKDTYSISVGNIYMLRKTQNNKYVPHVMNIFFYNNNNRIEYLYLEFGNFIYKISKKEFNSIELITF